jgi:hypothetical protein
MHLTRSPPICVVSLTTIPDHSRLRPLFLPLRL